MNCSQITLICVLSFCCFLCNAQNNIVDIDPPEIPLGPALFDQNEAPEIDSIFIFPQDPNHLDTIVLNVFCSDDSQVSEALIEWNVLQAIEHDSVAVLPQYRDGIYSLYSAIAPKTSGELVYKITVLDDELKSRQIEQSIQISVATPGVVADVTLETRSMSAYFNFSPAENSTATVLEVYSDENRTILYAMQTFAVGDNVFIDGLYPSTTYYYILKGKNDLAVGEEYLGVIQTTLNVPSIYCSTDTIDFGSIKMNNKSLVRSFQFDGELLSQDVSLRVPNGFQLSADSSSWERHGSTLSLLPDADGNIVDQKIYIQFKPEQSGEFIDTLFFVSGVDTLYNFEVSGFAKAVAPNASVGQFEVKCYSSEDLSATWVIDENSLPEYFVLVFVDRTINFDPNTMTSSFTESIRFTSSDTTCFVISPNQRSFQLTEFPSISVFDAYMFSMNGVGENRCLKTDGDIPKSTVVTPKKSVPVAWINEIHYDNDGADADECVEVLILDSLHYTSADFGLSIYDPDSTLKYDRLALEKGVDPSIFIVNVSSLRNSGVVGLALSCDDIVLDFVSYHGVLKALDGVAEGLVSRDIGVEESSSTPINMSLQLMGDGCRCDDFVWANAKASTFGYMNTDQSVFLSKTIWLGNELSTWDNPNNWTNGVPVDGSDVVFLEHSRAEIPDITHPKYNSITTETDAQLLGDQYIGSDVPFYIHRSFGVDAWNYFTPPVENALLSWLTHGDGMTYLLYYNNALDSPWQYISDENTVLNLMQGYAIQNSRNASEYQFSGLLVQGNISRPMTHDPSHNNWHFFGNPFLSSLDWNLVDKSLTTGTVYLFDQTLPGYQTIHANGVTSDEDHVLPEIPSMQSFFIESTGVGDFTLKQSDRMIGNQSFYKSYSSEMVVRIDVSNGAMHDHLVIYNDERKEGEGYDIDFDSKKLFYFEENVPQICSYAGDVPLAIHGFNTLQNEFLFDIICAEEQTVGLTVEMEGDLGFDNIIQLFDKKELTTRVIEADSVCSIHISADDEPHRFTLQLMKQTANDITDEDMYHLFVEHQCVVIESFHADVNSCQVFDLLGRVVAEELLLQNEQHRIYLKPGVFFVKVGENEVRKICVR